MVKPVPENLGNTPRTAIPALPLLPVYTTLTRTQLAAR
jgi:hypothetical protein